MVRRETTPRSPHELREEFPIEGKLDNWFFRARETSNNAWTIDGVDIWGRRVSRSGTDPEALLEACVNDATEIASRTAGTSIRPDEPRTMDDKVAYLAMFDFLDRRYQLTQSDDIGALLGAMSLLEDGGTADPALWNDWLSSVERARTGAVDALIKLSDDGA